jgi:FixJ family two-component response regulator
MKTESDETPTIFIVDDDVSMRRSTSMLVESAGFKAAAYESAQSFLADYKPDARGVVLLDLQMPGMSGMDLIERLHAEGSTIPVVAVSGTGTIPQAVKGMKLGLLDFLEKPADPTVLMGKVRAALDLDAAKRKSRSDHSLVHERFSDLTTREREVLEMLVRGLASKQIATELGISVKTVENHRTHIMEKSKAANVAELVRLWMVDQQGRA